MPSYQTRLEAARPHPADYPANPQTLGEHLRKRRMDLGARQEDVAERFGVKTESLGTWERDERTLAMTRWPAILSFLGYDPHPEPETLRERLEWIQRRRGWEHRDLARELRVSSSALSCWKAGGRPWSRRSVAAVRALLEDQGLACDDLAPRGGIAEHLVARRLELRLSQGEAARAIRVDCGTYRGWERYGKAPSAPSWPGVLAFLGYDPHPAPANVAEQLQAARRILGITQGELAERLGVTQGAVAQWEVGLGPGRPECVAAVEALLATVMWLPLESREESSSCGSKPTGALPTSAARLAV